MRHLRRAHITCVRILRLEKSLAVHRSHLNRLFLVENWIITCNRIVVTVVTNVVKIKVARGRT